MTLKEARAVAVSRNLAFGDIGLIEAVKMVNAAAELAEAHALYVPDVEDCDDCYGDGSCICLNCDAEHDCGKCDGTGERPDPEVERIPHVSEKATLEQLLAGVSVARRLLAEEAR